MVANTADDDRAVRVTERVLSLLSVVVYHDASWLWHAWRIMMPRAHCFTGLLWYWLYLMFTGETLNVFIIFYFSTIFPAIFSLIFQEATLLDNLVFLVQSMKNPCLLYIHL